MANICCITMNSGMLWSKTNLGSLLLKQDLQKFSALLKWTGYREDVLDVGCANGQITETVLYPHFKDRVRKLVAVDKCQSMIDFAREHNQIEQIEYRKMDVTKEDEVQIFKGKFDRIFVPLVAHLIPDNRSLLATLRTMLKPSGQIFLTAMVDTPVHRSFYRMAAEQTWAKYLANENLLYPYGKDPSKLFTELATSVGFKVDACESRRGSGPMAHYPDILKVLISFVDTTGLIPDEYQESYYKDHLRISLEFCTYLGKPDVVEYPYEKLVCVATRID